MPKMFKHERKDQGGARRLSVSVESPAPTVMAGGLGSVHTSQYTVASVGSGNEPVSVDVSKPPYRIPLMAEIDAVKPNGFSVASTFSGCGGSSLGYRMAGFRVLWASEFVQAARESYAANMRPGTVLDARDIREVTPEDVLQSCRLEVGQLDLLDGSPPCASFSTAGARQKHWGEVKKYSDVKQRTDDLFFEFARLVKGIQPKTFVAENVSGLVKGTAKGYFLAILKELKSCGYRVKCRLLDAQWLGVPQMRQRTIFVGVREDLKDVNGYLIEPAHPKPFSHRYSIRDAVPWISGGGGTQHFHVEAAADMSKYATGREWDVMGEPNELDNVQSDRYFQLVKPALGKPCPTVTAEGGNACIASVCHPTERRKFSIAELKRVCSFPDDFVLTGSYAQRWERLGRAVPPLMMNAIAETIRDEILAKITHA